jgi:competence protein ComEA
MARYALLLMALPALAQLPEGPGRAEVESACKLCHEVARSVAPRQDRDAWSHTMQKMVAYGMKIGDREYALILEYLARHFPAEEVPKVNVNTAKAIELEAGLSLRRSQAAALIAWREKHGRFQSLEDLKKVPLIEPDKLEAKRHRIAF